MPSARSASVSTPRPRPSCCRNVRRAVSIRPGRAGRRRPPVHRSRIRSIAASSRLLTSLAATRPRKRFMAGRSARYRHLHHLLDQHADEKPRQHRQELGHVGRRQEQGDQEEQRPGAEPVQGDVGRGRQRDREDARHVRSGPGARRDQGGSRQHHRGDVRLSAEAGGRRVHRQALRHRLVPPVGPARDDASRRTTTRTTERSLRASADRRHGWKPAAYLCGIRWSARLSPGQTSQAYVVSAFRRTRHGPAKAGHYGQQETAGVQRRVGRPACASRSGGWDDVAARNGRERCCSTMEQARCHRRSRVSG